MFVYCDINYTGRDTYRCLGRARTVVCIYWARINFQQIRLFQRQLSPYVTLVSSYQIFLSFKLTEHTQFLRVSHCCLEHWLKKSAKIIFAIT